MQTLLYHGSTAVVDHPLVSVGRADLDFGQGFYLTPLFEQAESWAKKVRIIRNAPAAYVNTYLYEPPTDCRMKRFDAYDEEWLQFIVDSRTGRRPWEGYDIIEGGIADDRVIDAVEAYISGYADAERTLGLLVHHKPNWQICILSQSVLSSCLTYRSHQKLG